MKNMEFSLHYNVKPKLRDDCLLKPGQQDIPFMKLTILQDEPRYGTVLPSSLFPYSFSKYKPWWFTGYITYYRVLSQGYRQSPFESITTKTSRCF